MQSLVKALAVQIKEDETKEDDGQAVDKTEKAFFCNQDDLSSVILFFYLNNMTTKTTI